MKKLNSCYKCSSKVRLHQDDIDERWYIECSKCGLLYGLSLGEIDWYGRPSKDLLIAEWNGEHLG
jgi:hypothetical protein